MQLDISNLSYCEISECGPIQGLKITNTQMLVGERELWLKVLTKDGRVLKMANVQISMDLKSRTIAECLLVRDKRAILNVKLILGY